MPAVDTRCPECRARIAGDQRYCLDCGHRVGPLRLDWRELLAARRAAPAAPAGATAPVALPTPRVAATLLLIVLGFGVVVAGAATSDPTRALAATARAPLTVVLPDPPRPVPIPDEPAAPEPAPAPEPEPDARPEEPAAATEPDAGAPAADEPDEEVVDGPVDTPDPPAVEHVFVVSLGTGTYEQWFGATATVPYLATELAPQGALLAGYRATAAGELANQIAMVSGQPANAQTDANCPVYTPFDGTEGCLYPLDVYTLPDQLVAAGQTWRAYVEGHAGCVHPEDGAADTAATWRNPFVYFQTITTSLDCAANDAGLPALDGDLADAERTATFSWIAPSPENGTPATAEAWLRTVVPKILASDAYADHGLLAIVPAASGIAGDPVTGALLLSSEHVAPGAIDTTAYDHLSLLKSIEELLSLRYLAGAGAKKVKSFVSPLLH